uniref:Uncharacterized protein n=1 Tax=Plectus sambesii TaxID=2011161 RepID=A0A914WGU7_9BILA
MQALKLIALVAILCAANVDQADAQFLRYPANYYYYYPYYYGYYAYPYYYYGKRSAGFGAANAESGAKEKNEVN